MVSSNWREQAPLKRAKVLILVRTHKINIVKDPNAATIVNWICGCIFIPLAYILTGAWYKGGAKAVGSFGFFINYAILTGLFLMITKFITNLYLVAFLFILGYAILCIVESKLFGEKNLF